MLCFFSDYLFMPKNVTFKNNKNPIGLTFRFAGLIMSHTLHHRDSDSFDIRNMEIGDLAPVFYLGERLFTADKWPALYRTWDEFEVVTFFTTDTDTCFVATRNEKVIGFALGNIIEKDNSTWRYGYCVWLGVDPDIERGGVGSALFKAMRDKFIEKGARMILVDTDANNEPAIKFFKKHGFNHENKHVYLSMNLTHSPEYQHHRKRES